MGAQRRRCPRGCKALVTAVAVVLVSACSSTPPPSPSPVPSTVSAEPTPSPVESPSPTPSPAPSPSPTSTLNEEQAAAVDTVLEFFRLKNELSKDPTLEVQPLASITTGQTQSLEIYYLGQDRENGVIQTGDDLYYVTAVGSVSERGDARVMAVEVCTDSTATDLIVQETGESILGPDRAYFVEWQIEVLHEGYRWKVGDITSGRVERCGP